MITMHQIVESSRMCTAEDSIELLSILLWPSLCVFD